MDSKHIYKALGVYLTNVRKNRKMTQKEMGESVNHNRSWWADLENGRTAIKFDKIIMDKYSLDYKNLNDFIDSYTDNNNSKD
jgi:transcriptional regulator with XRE-family HTH domain